MLSGIAWDHRRCWGPLVASAPLYEAEHGVAVRWDRRSLYSFGEGDLADFTDAYDLIIYDHPFVGDVASRGLMLDLGRFLSEDDRAAFAADSVGASWASYAFEGGVWALPIDAAAQAAAWRPDLMDRLGAAVPQTLEETLALADAARAAGLWVGWPAKPTDLMCTLLSLAASDGAEIGIEGGPFLDGAAAGTAIDRLRALAAAVHPMSRGWNPIGCLDHMSGTDEIAYVPYTFNYVNYAALPARRVRFGAPPATAAGHPGRGLLGGAGIGVSARSKNPEAAFAYAMHLCSPEVQAGLYVEHGGQPASRTAWLSDAANRLAGGFFRDTLQTLDDAYLRPTVPGFVPFFHEATLRLFAVVHEDAPAAPFVDWLDAAYDRLGRQRRPEMVAP